jgi:hypothetical protein
MNTCEFCGSDYSPRRQVKNPRACRKRLCQSRRQTANEREWREKNDKRFGAGYFSCWRKRSFRRRLEVRQSLIEALRIGMSFLGRQIFDIGFLSEFITDFVRSLGMRIVNKLCSL